MPTKVKAKVKKGKMVYLFGGGKAEGKAEMKELLGGKGANLAEMANLGIPVPAGFTITTEVCNYFGKNKKTYPAGLDKEVKSAVAKAEKIMNAKFGNPKNPLLVSVRSGARQSMPGMMETVLNVGLTSKTIKGLIEKTKNERFAYDAYRRLIMMYSDVVMEKAAGIEPDEGKGIRLQLEHEMEKMKRSRGYRMDTDLKAEDLKELAEIFKKKIKSVLGKDFPDDPWEQLWGGIGAVFQSWNGKRAVSYRRIEGIADEWGTAVNVQAMVFGNMGDQSATGVAFTRNPATGANIFYGEWLINAQGEDVVAGIRTPNPLNKECKTDDTAHLKGLDEVMPKTYQQLAKIRAKLEKHYHDMQDIEFTIQEGRLWMLQTRSGKRNGPSAVKMAVDMCNEKLIDKKTAIMRVKPSQLDELLHDMLDPRAELKAKEIAKGLPAGPGGATGQVVFSADTAEEWAQSGKKIILVRAETSPEDVHGMHVAQAILTAKGGMTSHAALVARGWGKCCIVGCSALQIDMTTKSMTVGGEIVNEGDWISLNGTSGRVYLGQIATSRPDLSKNKEYVELMKWADEIRTLGVRTNADRPADAKQALDFGAEGIGLTRTEHMFFGPERIGAMRQMIIAETEQERRAAVMKLLPFQRDDFFGLFKVMAGKPVTIRLLDPPLHEFVAMEEKQIKEMAEENMPAFEKGNPMTFKVTKYFSKSLKAATEKLKTRIQSLHELNPMLGHRGCRLGIAYPEITEMQARAIFEAAATLIKQGVAVQPEVMVPLVGTLKEFQHQEAIIRTMAKEVMKEKGVKFDYKVGTMIEIPRAALTADEIAQSAEFFSFGTNDLTQTTFGFSRDDIGGFLPIYLSEKILPEDPFQSLDQKGVGQLVEMGTQRGRSTRKNLKVGICGEHGGDPKSIDFCHRVGLDYVSCSPFRVPIARLAAAHAAIINSKK
jgi:pyruvate, orthophosphate dikinase